MAIIPLEFIHLIASEANEICEKEAKKTIAAEHVITALQVWDYLPYNFYWKFIFYGIN